MGQQVSIKRLILIALVTAAVGAPIALMVRRVDVVGHTMHPTYQAGRTVWMWRPGFLFRVPRAGDAVLVRVAAPAIFELTRVVAVSGDHVEFNSGRLVVDGEPVGEPYVQNACDWDVPLRTVPPGHVYIVGDNRNMPQEQHLFGPVPVARIVGVPLW